MSHDRGCHKCGRDPRHYSDCSLFLCAKRRVVAIVRVSGGLPLSAELAVRQPLWYWEERA